MKCVEYDADFLSKMFEQNLLGQISFSKILSPRYVHVISPALYCLKRYDSLLLALGQLLTAINAPSQCLPLS